MDEHSFHDLACESPADAVRSLFDTPSEERGHGLLKSLGPTLDRLSEQMRATLLTEGTGAQDMVSGWLWLATELCARPPQARPPKNWSRWIDRALDAMVGINYSSTEAQVPSRLESDRAEAIESEIGMASWSGSGRLSQSSLNTPYVELFRQIESLALPTHAVVADLGCGYGRLGYVVGALFPSARFYGYEIVEPRVRACQKASQFLNLEERVKFEHVDLSSQKFSPPQADLYYLYDPVNEETLLRVMRSLETTHHRGSEFLILARGRTGALHSVLESQRWLELESKPHQGEMLWAVYRTSGLRGSN